MTFINWIATIKPEGVLTAIVAGLIGRATWRIAWVQKEIAKEKIISDLFEKRFSIYQAHLQAVVEIVIRGKEGES